MNDPRRLDPRPPAAPPPAVPRRPRRQFLLLMMIFLAPILAALAVYFLFPGLRPAGTTNYGRLVLPARPLPPLALRDAAGQPAAAGLFKGKWSLVYVAGSDCADACRKQIYLSRQVRTALDRDAQRLQRVYIAPDAGALAAARGALGPEQPDLLWLADTGNGGARAADFFQPGAPEALYLLDPLGNWLMIYPPAADSLQDFRGVLKDLKRLLSQSQID